MIDTGSLVLSAPALLLAGIAASPHCLLMCGSLAGSTVQGPAARACGAVQASLLVSFGRLSGYAVAGGLAGAAGGWLLPRLPPLVGGQFFRALAGVLLIGIAVLQWQRLGRGTCGSKPPAGPAARTARAPIALNALAASPFATEAAPQPEPPGPAPAARVQLLLRGGAWSLLPCPLLYAVLGLAALSASTLSGAALLAAFGAGTLPLMASASWLSRRLTPAPGGLRGLRWQRGGAALLGMLGAATLGSVALADWQAIAAWCL